MESTTSTKKKEEDLSSNLENLALNTSRDSAEEETPFFRLGTSTSPSDPMTSHANNAGAWTPPRPMSSNSLYGEDFVMTSRRSSSREDPEFLISPSLLSQSEATTPPSSVQPLSLSPPPLNNDNLSFSSRASKNNNSGAAIRPPRAPNVNLRFSSSSVGALPVPKPQLSNSTSNNSEHQRATSTGDASLMSALTDSSSYEGPPHQRAYSWDQAVGTDMINEFSLDVDIPSSLQQPVLMDDGEMMHGINIDIPSNLHQLPSNVKEGTNDSNVTPPSPGSMEASMSEKQTTPPGNNKKAHRRVMTDVTRYELEAETLIIQAIDDMKEKQKKKPEERLFPEITEESAELMAKSSSEEGEESRRSKLTRVATTLMALQKDAATEKTTPPEATKADKNKEDGHFSSEERMAANIATFQAAAKLKAKAVRRRRNATKDPSTGAFPYQADEIQLSHTQSTDEEEMKPPVDIETGENSSNQALSYLKTAAVDTPRRLGKGLMRATQVIKRDVEDFDEFLEPNKSKWRSFLWNLTMLIILPSLAVASLLFYALDNPPTGKANSSRNVDPTKASASWWLIFLGVRHMLTLALAKGTELVLVQYLAFSSPRFIRLTGPNLGLLITQSQGWPCVIFFVGLYDLFLLCGDNRFAKHWLFFQTAIEMFSAINPAGTITANLIYRNLLIGITVAGFLVSLRRLWAGQHLGARLYTRYHDRVVQAMEDMVLVSEVAYLAKERDVPNFRESFQQLVSESAGDYETKQELSRDLGTRDEAPFFINESSGVDMLGLLDDWGDVDGKEKEVPQVTTLDILHIERATMSMRTDFPFSVAFGLASSRKECVNSAVRLYNNLLKRQSEQNELKFVTIAEVAVRRSSRKIDKKRMKRLLEVFRPDKNGNMNLLDFVRSIDDVYKRLAFLSRSIENAAKIDRAYESIINVFFYLILLMIVCGIMGFNIIPFLLALASLLVSFAFMIGPAASGYFEGLMLMILRRPYDIGDRIAISPVDEETDEDGMTGWVVEDMDLYSTTVRSGATREVATLANGSIAKSKIINMNRSTKAQVKIYLKFSVDTPFERILVLQKAVEQYVKDHPREWVGVTGFRASRIEADLGYVQYDVVLQHRKAWQDIVAVLESKANLSSFCLELQKQLNMRYVAPPMPIDLTMLNSLGPKRRESEVARRSVLKTDPQTPSDALLDEKIETIAKMFENKKSK